MSEATRSEPAFAPPPQLNYALGNPDAPGTIYVSADPADNALTLVMSATAAAGFTAGTLVPPGQAMSGTGSLLYLNLTPLGLTEAEFEALELVADGWTYALYDEPTGQYIGFTPTAPASLQPLPATIGFALDALTMAQQPGASASLDLLAYRVAGVTSGSFPISGSIAVLFALPDNNEGDLTAAMQVALTPGQLVTTLPQYAEIDNQLLLTLTQNPNAPTINAGPDTVFTLNFVYSSDANGYGALLTVPEGKQVKVAADQGTTNWTITPNLDADPPFWTLIPPAGAPLFSSGAGSTLAFDIGQLVTAFQPGPTPVLLGYSNVPGYKNGSFAITIMKQPHVVIDSFQVSPPQSVLTGTPPNASASVTLSWSTTYATRLTLQPLGIDVTGQTSWPATIGATTQFTLVAEGQAPGNVDNVASSSVVAQVVPVINGFTASPPNIYMGDFSFSPTGYPVTLAWDVNTNSNVTLTSSATGPVGPAFPPVSSTQISIAMPQTLTLTVQGTGRSGSAGGFGRLIAFLRRLVSWVWPGRSGASAKRRAGAGNPVSESLDILGFRMRIDVTSIGKDSGWVAAYPNIGAARPFAVTAPFDNLVTILSGTGQGVITTVPVGNTPVGVAFSPDGKLMYVANFGDGTVSIFTVDLSRSLFSPAGAPVPVAGTPMHVVVGLDGTCYVTVHNENAPGWVATITRGAGGFAAATLATVGQTPYGLALSPDGTSLYVANSASGTISRITLGGSNPPVETLISGVGGPVGVAVTADGATLLVAAQTDGAVYGYDVRHPNANPRQVYPLPGASWVAPFPTGTYAVAAAAPNGAASTVALLNHRTGKVVANQAVPGINLAYGAAVSTSPASTEYCIVSGQGGTTVAAVTFDRYSRDMVADAPAADRAPDEGGAPEPVSGNQRSPATFFPFPLGPAPASTTPPAAVETETQ